MLGGKLRPSGFKYPLRYTAGEWPPIAGDVVVDSLGPRVLFLFYRYQREYINQSGCPDYFLGHLELFKLVESLLLSKLF